MPRTWIAVDQSEAGGSGFDQNFGGKVVVVQDQACRLARRITPKVKLLRRKVNLPVRADGFLGWQPLLRACYCALQCGVEAAVDPERNVMMVLILALQ